MIGALLYLEISLAQRLKLNYLSDDPPDLNGNEAAKLSMINVDLWNKPTISTPIGNQKYAMFHVSPIGGGVNPDGTLVWLEHFRDVVVQKLANGVGGIGTIPANQIKWWGGIVGVWNDDGSQYSDEFGSPVYPIHAAAMQFMPDDVTYDSNGNETSRVPASDYKEVNKLFGWSDRVWV